jgi:NAD/NADP transhydrogenase alpha subunit
MGLLMATNIPVTTKSPTLSSDMGTLPLPKTDTVALAEKQKASLSGFAFERVVDSSNAANTDAISLDNIITGFVVVVFACRQRCNEKSMRWRWI